MVRRVTARGVIVHNGKLFCVKQRNSAGQVVDYWCTPGGGLDIGEPIITGLVREMIEETGIKPKIGNLVLIQQFIDSKGREQLEFFFHVTNSEDYLNINLKNTSHGKHEIDDFAFVDAKTTHILPVSLKEIDFGSLNTLQKPLIINEIPKDAPTEPEN